MRLEIVPKNPAGIIFFEITNRLHMIAERAKETINDKEAIPLYLATACLSILRSWKAQTNR